ncbi:MAG: alanine--glyoxylate aminotransferase family protein [Candidatus Sericytochromatia bacterium]|nr:alanine--glyoxylate aminotransferase family protein [Candidatus Tanganyikabacteria bacterium]
MRGQEDQALHDIRLMIPGPTPVPDEVLREMARPMINHRSPMFSAILADCRKGAQWLYRTSHDVIFMTASGTGGLEAALVNVLSPGDRVLSLVSGVFGKRFADMAQVFGAEVHRVETRAGEAYDPARVAEALEAGPFKAVLMTHNETSTAVLNPIEQVAAMVRARWPEALILVDAVSGLGSAPLETDAWGLDVVVSGSQKAFSVPPGLAMLAVSPRAWQAVGEARCPRFYFDLGKARDFDAKGQTPWTPAISVFYALAKALERMQAEGLEGILGRHLELTTGLRSGLRALGMELLVKDEAAASRAVTAVFPPAGVAPSDFRKRMQAQYGIVLAGGQGALTDSIFRVGHLGHCSRVDILGCLAALESVLVELGAPVEPGRGVAGAQLAWQQPRPAAVGA